MPKIILIVGASGVGKDTLLSYARKNLGNDFNFVKRYIDRKADRSENNHFLESDYFFAIKDFFISSWVANGHNYGIAKHSIEEKINIISISRGAIKDFEKNFEDVSVVEIYTNEKLLKERLEKRAREDSEQIKKRLANAKKPIKAKKLYRFENSKSLKESQREFVDLLKEIASEFIPFFKAQNNPSKNLHFLGTSDSEGIPSPKCKCEICQNYRKKQKNNYTSSAYLQNEDKSFILIDAGNEEICKAFENHQIKAIFLTHFHADHCAALLRMRYSDEKILCFCPFDEQGFCDLFKHKKNITYRFLKPFESVMIGDFKFSALKLIHSKPTLGYFIESKNENIAYLSDCANLPKESFDFLKKQKIDTCFIDAGAKLKNDIKNTNNHLDYTEATKILDELKPKKARLIHINHQILNELDNKNLKYPYLL